MENKLKSKYPNICLMRFLFTVVGKEGDALSSMLFNFAFEYTIRNFHAYRESFKLNGKRQFLVYANNINLFGGKYSTVWRNKKALLAIIRLWAGLLSRYSDWAMPMRHNIISCVPCLDVPYFATLAHTSYEFRQNVIKYKNMCFDFLYSFCPKHYSFYGGFSEILGL
jgi:hypothetical protein